MKAGVPYKINRISDENVDELKVLCRRSLDNEVIKKRLSSKRLNVDSYVDSLFEKLWLNEIEFIGSGVAV